MNLRSDYVGGPICHILNYLMLKISQNVPDGKITLPRTDRQVLNRRPDEQEEAEGEETSGKGMAAEAVNEADSDHYGDAGGGS